MEEESLHYKYTTVASYEKRVQEVGNPLGLDAYFRRRGRHEADIFLSGLKEESLILDLGCGVGLTSLYFWIKEHRVVSTDLGQALLERCRERGLRNLARLDQEHVPFAPESFDGVWSHTALNHVPKAILREKLCQIGELVKPGAQFFICVKS
ncbi:MAG: class I SAM-dependent methyltransferase, partial [Candidatus Latescibacteria bacterium]|nr:class I SAM-dependent methyltransferase [Candidatus Latescibacterota bacterium]